MFMKQPPREGDGDEPELKFVEVEFNPTFDVKRLVIVCPCGCGVLSDVECHGFVQAHVWPDQIRFTMKSRFLSWLFWRVFKVKPIRGLLVMLEFTDGKRLQCEPVSLKPGRYPDICTDRPCLWRELR